MVTLENVFTCCFLYHYPCKTHTHLSPFTSSPLPSTNSFSTPILQLPLIFIQGAADNPPTSGSMSALIRREDSEKSKAAQAVHYARLGTTAAKAATSVGFFTLEAGTHITVRSPKPHGGVSLGTLTSRGFSAPRISSPSQEPSPPAPSLQSLGKSKMPLLAATSTPAYRSTL